MKPAQSLAEIQEFPSTMEPRYLALLEGERAHWWSSQNFDTWKNLYVSEYTRGFYVLSVLARYAPDFRVEGAKVLDIGCGDAGVLIALAENGACASGMEVSERSLHRGRVRAEEHAVDIALCAAVAEALPYPDESQDLILLDNVLEHVQDQERTLAEIRRVLRPGGLLYMVTPKPFALYSLWNDPHYDLAGLVLLPRQLQIWYFERVRGGGSGTYDVGQIPTRRRLKRLLREAGFDSIVAPRELWINYLRARIERPGQVNPGPKRWLAERLRRWDWPFSNPVARWAWDIAIGSNFFLARRLP